MERFSLCQGIRHQRKNPCVFNRAHQKHSNPIIKQMMFHMIILRIRNRLGTNHEGFRLLAFPFPTSRSPPHITKTMLLNEYLFDLFDLVVHLLSQVVVHVLLTVNLFNVAHQTVDHPHNCLHLEGKGLLHPFVHRWHHNRESFGY